MHISNEGILAQLGYPNNETNQTQLAAIIENTPGFETIKRHLIALADHIKPYGGYIAFSNSKPYLKIKIDQSNPSLVSTAVEEILKWAQKYNITLEEVKSGETYYILGVSK